MTDEQRQEIMRRQAEGMRAMSGEEMARRQLDNALVARNAWPEFTSQQLAQGSENWWRHQRTSRECAPVVKPQSHSRWELLKRWMRGA